MRILLCRCTHRDILPAGAADAVREALSACGVELVETDDLCSLAASGRLAECVSDAEPTLICACHPRAVRALFERAGLESPGDGRVFDLRAEAVAELGARVKAAAGECSVRSVAADDAWYPVIDYARCSSCGKCFGFCLFGVYSRDEDGQVTVSAPLSCKNNCPACARICPENAIIFPKCTDDALNGAVLTEEQLRGARIRLDPADVRGEGLMAKLRGRTAAGRAQSSGLLRDDALRRLESGDSAAEPRRES